MRITERDLYASGLPACWAAVYEALRPASALQRAVHHTTESLNRMPAGYRWGTSAALRLFPSVFRAVTRARPHTAPPELIRAGLARLRGLPGYAEVLRATTALALYGALDGVAPPHTTRTREAVR
ncbi:hypothetical protein ACIA6T_34945 [Streptomyces sp. NPDC051740]|uniref:hypothetical protein n=1 Tax=Streptomyces sp. NPDC051740 TaxID=3365673 RepID=UPI00379B3600